MLVSKLQKLVPSCSSTFKFLVLSAPDVKVPPFVACAARSLNIQTAVPTPRPSILYPVEVVPNDGKFKSFLQ